jgi:hypothetical protein
MAEEAIHSELTYLANPDGKKELMRESGSVRVPCRHDFLRNASVPAFHTVLSCTTSEWKHQQQSNAHFCKNLVSMFCCGGAAWPDLFLDAGSVSAK